MEIISLWWECVNNRYTCKWNQTSGSIIKLWWTTDIWTIKNFPADYIILVLFPIEDLRVAVDTAKRVLTKEKIDMPLSGHSGTTTLFMKVGDVHNSNRKTVSFNTQDPIQEQLDNLNSMVYNISIQKEGHNRPFKAQIHQ